MKTIPITINLPKDWDDKIPPNIVSPDAGHCGWYMSVSGRWQLDLEVPVPK